MLNVATRFQTGFRAGILKPIVLSVRPPGFASLEPRGDPVDALVLVVGASVRPADVPLLADRLGALLRESGDAGEVLCDVAAITEPDGATLDALARLQLAAQRLDGRIKLRGAHRRLRGLLILTGLSEVLPVAE